MNNRGLMNQIRYQNLKKEMDGGVG
jgi:hypothetical protein